MTTKNEQIETAEPVLGTEEQTISAAQSIMGVMRAVSHVAKRDKNSHQQYLFRGIDAVVNAVGPALREVGGFITHDVLEAKYERGATAKGGATIEVFLRVEYSWHGTDGTSVNSVVVSEAMDTSDKATAKAMSVAYRTYLLQILMLPTDEPDPDHDYTERGTAQQSAAPAKPVDPAVWTDAAKNAPTLDDAVKVWQEAKQLVVTGHMAQTVLDAVAKVCQDRKAEQGESA